MTTSTGKSKPLTHDSRDEPSIQQAMHWQELVNAVGEEISTPLTHALERIHSLTTSGRIDRQSLRALREEVEAARSAGIVAQQITRLASGRLRQTHERLDIAELTHQVITHRARELQNRGLTTECRMSAVHVIVDAYLMFSLLNALLDWVMLHATANLQLSVLMQPGQTSAQFICQFRRDHVNQTRESNRGQGTPSKLNSLTWRLMEQIGWTMRLPLNRTDSETQTTVYIDFPRTAAVNWSGVNSAEVDQGFAPSTNSKPLAGSHVLIVASRRDLRLQLRESIKDMGLTIDMVSSVEEAADFCREGLPHAIVFESILRSARFKQLREEIIAEIADFAFVEIVEEGNRFEISGSFNHHTAQIGKGAIDSALPSVLMFELSKSL